jgi:hypothetical protein
MSSRITRLLLLVLLGAGASAMIATSFTSTETSVEDPLSSTGSVRIVASLLQSSQASEIATVQATLSGPGLPPITVPLTPEGVQWGAELGRLPASHEYTLVAEALDTRGDLVLSAQATGLSVAKARTSLAALALQAPVVQVPPMKGGPRISALTTTSVRARPGEFLELRASVLGDDPYNPLSYEWTASAGTLSSPRSASTGWTAPTSPAFVTFTFTVTGAQGISTSASLALLVDRVQPQPTPVSFDHAPLVTEITELHAAVKLGQSMPVSATVVDEEPGALSYQWSAACAGIWEDEIDTTARFTPGYQGGKLSCTDCPLHLTITDRQGVRTTRTVSLCVGPEVDPQGLPQLVNAFQSASSANAGERLTFRVIAADPLRADMSFSWSASAGILGTPSGDGSRSEVVWTAPLCRPKGGEEDLSEREPVSLAVTVTNALGERIVPFYVYVSKLPKCDT